jgi:hypothetical protein
MTVSTQQNRASFAADGVSTQFDFAFPFARASHIRVYIRTAAGVTTELANNQFTLTQPGGGIGGRITLLVPAPASGSRVVIVRIPEPLQETDLLENDAFFAETIERAFDYLTLMDQRHSDLLSRSLVLGESDLPGAGAFQAGGNRITALADAVAATDAAPLGQVQALIAASGGGGGSGGGGPVEPGPATWPTTPVPQSILDQINANPGLSALFSPLNTTVGNLSASVLSLNSSIATINTSVGNLTVTTTDLQDQIDTLSAIGGDVSGIVVLLNNETSARIAGDTAIASTIARLGASDGDGVSFLINTATAKIGPSETLGARLISINTQLGSASAAITTEQTARIAGDNVLTTTVSRLGALSGDGTAFIINLDTARVGPTETLAQRFSGITSAVNGANAAITAESSTRAAADASIATTVTTLQSTLNGQVTTIQQNSTAINGIQAKYSVKVDNNGHVSGFGLISEANSGTVVSTFNVLANVFRIVDPAGGLTTPLIPFSVSGGVVTMQNVQIGGSLLVAGSVGTTQIANLGVTSAKLADNAVTSAKILSGAVTGTLIADGAITTTKLAAGSITAGSGIIANAAITTALIGDAQITSAKIASISADLITTGTLNAARINAGTITADKIAGGAVSSSDSNTAAGTFNHTTWTTRGTLTFTPETTGSRLMLFASGVVTIGDAATVGTNAQVRITRGGTVIYGPVVVSNLRANPIPYSFQLTQTSLSGAQTFNIEYQASATHGLGDPHSVTNSGLTILELKK